MTYNTYIIHTGTGTGIQNRKTGTCTPSILTHHHGDSHITATGNTCQAGEGTILQYIAIPAATHPCCHHEASRFATGTRVRTHVYPGTGIEYLELCASQVVTRLMQRNDFEKDGLNGATGLALACLAVTRDLGLRGQQQKFKSHELPNNNVSLSTPSTRVPV